MRRVSGTLNGTGAALVVGCGFVPDWVKLSNLEVANPITIEWNRDMRSLEQIEGIACASDGTQNLYARLTYGTGVAPYRGGDKMTAASTVYVSPVEFVAGERDMRDKYVAGGGAPVTKWVLDTAATRKGHFDVEASDSYVGEGSKILVYNSFTKKTYDVTVLAMTSNGEGSEEVTLSEVVPSGDVMFLGPMFDYVGAPKNHIVEAGFKINTTGALNTSGELISFEAGQYL